MNFSEIPEAIWILQNTKIGTWHKLTYRYATEAMSPGSSSCENGFGSSMSYLSSPLTQQHRKLTFFVRRVIIKNPEIVCKTTCECLKKDGEESNPAKNGTLRVKPKGGTKRNDRPEGYNFNLLLPLHRLKIITGSWQAPDWACSHGRLANSWLIQTIEANLRSLNYELHTAFWHTASYSRQKWCKTACTATLCQVYQREENYTSN